MSQSVQPVEVTPAPVVPPTCDRDCTSLAEFAYSWEWGENGVCCGSHKFLLHQAAGQIERSVSFSPLVAPGPTPLTRTERIALKSEVYALESELEDLKTRGLELYRANNQLTVQLQATSTRARETEARLRDSEAENARLRTDLTARDAEHGDLVDEVERLRAIAAFVPQNPPV